MVFNILSYFNIHNLDVYKIKGLHKTAYFESQCCLYTARSARQKGCVNRPQLSYNNNNNNRRPEI